MHAIQQCVVRSAASRVVMKARAASLVCQRVPVLVLSYQLPHAVVIEQRAICNFHVLRHLSFLHSIITLLSIYLEIPTGCSLLTSLFRTSSLSNHVLASNRGANCTRRWTGEEELPCKVGSFKIH